VVARGGAGLSQISYSFYFRNFDAVHHRASFVLLPTVSSYMFYGTIVTEIGSRDKSLSSVYAWFCFRYVTSWSSVAVNFRVGDVCCGRLWYGSLSFTELSLSDGWLPAVHAVGRRRIAPNPNLIWRCLPSRSSTCWFHYRGIFRMEKIGVGVLSFYCSGTAF